jgi:hypothetical protein
MNMAVSNNALTAERNWDACYDVDIEWSDYPKRLEKVIRFLVINLIKFVVDLLLIC